MATKTIVGEKVGMTQVWDDNNNVIPVTVVRVTPCRVVQVKTPDSDGYSALQVTYGSKDPRKLTKPVAGHYESAGVDPGIKLVELRIDDKARSLDWTAGRAALPGRGIAGLGDPDGRRARLGGVCRRAGAAAARGEQPHARAAPGLEHGPRAFPARDPRLPRLSRDRRPAGGRHA